MDESPIGAGLASLQTRARIATLGIYLFILLNVLRAAVGFANAIGVIDLMALPSQAYVNAYDVILYGSLVAFYVSALAVAFWIYRAHKNLIDAGCDGLEFTAGWSIGWFFVPIANFYMPYKAMREAWHASLGQSGDTSPPPLLTIWWSSYLAGNIADWLVVASPSFEPISRIAMICSAWALGRIIARITQGQDMVKRYAETFA